MAGSTGMLRVSIGFVSVKRNFLGPGSLQGYSPVNLHYEMGGPVHTTKRISAHIFE